MEPVAQKSFSQTSPLTMTILGFDLGRSELELSRTIKRQPALANILLIFRRVERNLHPSSLSTLS